MGYLIMQMLLFLILTVVLGFVIGWWLKTVLVRTAAGAALIEGDVSALAAGDGGQSEMAQLRREASLTKQTLAARDTELAELREELANAWTQASDAPSAALRERLTASEHDLEACRQQVAGLRAQLAAASAETAPPSRGSSAPPDDLQMISGIGAKLEATLHELGIRHFRQIAEFTPENVAWVNERLRFKGRIERERWIEQAKQLAAGSETEFSARHKGK